MRLAGGLVDRVVDDAVAVLEARGEHAVVSGGDGVERALLPTLIPAPTHSW